MNKTGKEVRSGAEENRSGDSASGAAHPSHAERGEDEQVERLINGIKLYFPMTKASETMIELVQSQARQIATLTAELEREKTNFPMLKRRIATLTAARDRAAEALRELWELWDDKEWCRYKADYLKGHLSYAGMLDEKEKPIRAALAASLHQPLDSEAKKP